MTWKKGQSGNPSGRPKVAGEVQELARQHTAEAINTLVAILRNAKAPPAARALAANSLLDRGYRRPAQSLDVGIRKTFEEMSDADLLAIAANDEEPTTKARMSERQGSISGPVRCPKHGPDKEQAHAGKQ